MRLNKNQKMKIRNHYFKWIFKVMSKTYLVFKSRMAKINLKSLLNEIFLVYNYIIKLL